MYSNRHKVINKLISGESVFLVKLLFAFSTCFICYVYFLSSTLLMAIIVTTLKEGKDFCSDLSEVGTDIMYVSHKRPTGNIRHNTENIPSLLCHIVHNCTYYNVYNRRDMVVGVCTSYAQGMHNVCTRYSQGMHKVYTRYVHVLIGIYLVITGYDDVGTNILTLHSR